MPKSQPATDAVRDQRGPDDASGLGRIIYLAPRRPLRTIAASAETRRDNVAASCWLTEGDWCAMDRRTQRKTQWTRSILCLIPVLALVLLALVLVSGMVMHLHQRPHWGQVRNPCRACCRPMRGQPAARAVRFRGETAGEPGAGRGCGGRWRPSAAWGEVRTLRKAGRGRPVRCGGDGVGGAVKLLLQTNSTRSRLKLKRG